MATLLERASHGTFQEICQKKKKVMFHGVLSLPSGV